MKIHSDSIKNGYFGDQFGHRGSQFLKDKKPSRSFHIAWDDLPLGVKTIAIVFIDYDAIPVCGFPWIHWAVANIDPKLGELPENASLEMDLLEGTTSWSSPIISEEWKLSFEDANGFGGCAPPDKEHLYTINVYALDTTLNLKRGFYLNEMLNLMNGHILDEATLQGIYKTL